MELNYQRTHGRMHLLLIDARWTESEHGARARIRSMRIGGVSDGSRGMGKRIKLSRLWVANAMSFGGRLIDLPLVIDGPDAVGAWVEVSGGGGMVGTDIVSMAT